MNYDYQFIKEHYVSLRLIYPSYWYIMEQFPSLKTIKWYKKLRLWFECKRFDWINTSDLTDADFEHIKNDLRKMERDYVKSSY